MIEVNYVERSGPLETAEIHVTGPVLNGEQMEAWADENLGVEGWRCDSIDVGAAQTVYLLVREVNA